MSPAKGNVDNTFEEPMKGILMNGPELQKKLPDDANKIKFVEFQINKIDDCKLKLIEDKLKIEVIFI